MQKTINVIGISTIEGVSKKTNNPYKLYIVHGTYPDSRTEGYASCALTVPSDYQFLDDIRVGSNLCVITHFANGREVFDGCYAV